MRTVQDYISEARKKNGIYSNNKLASAIGLTGPAIVNIVKNKALPSEETLLKIANLADISPEEALLDLSIWRAKSPEAKSTWEKIRNVMINLCIVISLIIPIGSGNIAAPERK